MRHLILASLAGIMGVLLLTGCQESESGQIQRARLVGRENLQLKKQIEAKDAEIAQLKKDLQDLQAAKDQASQQAGNTNFRVMQIVAETEKQKEQLQIENKALKAELEKLKAQ